MRNDNLTPEEVAEDRDRFYIYTDYEEQLAMLTHEQIGRAFLALYHYFHTGEKQVQEQEVNMMLSFMTSKLDKDAKYYARKVKERRDKASNAGKASAEARRKRAELAKCYEEICETDDLEQDAEEISTSVNTSALNQPDKEREKEGDREKENDNDKEKEREEDKLNYYYYSSSNSTNDSIVDNCTLIPYGREQYLTTQAEVEKIHALADELLHSYRDKKPTPDDYEKVFAYVHTIAVSEDGEHYGVYSREKADLLRHVFEQAALRSDMSWQYISGIYINYGKNHVSNVEEAIEYEGRWKRKEDTQTAKINEKRPVMEEYFGICL